MKDEKIMFSNNTAGQVLITALITMSIGLILGVGFLTYSRAAADIIKSQIDSGRAYYMARTGIERAWRRLADDFDAYHNEAFNFSSASSVAITVAPKDEQGRIVVTSNGRFNHAYQQVVRKFEKAGTTVKMSK